MRGSVNEQLLYMLMRDGIFEVLSAIERMLRFEAVRSRMRFAYRSRA